MRLNFFALILLSGIFLSTTAQAGLLATDGAGTVEPEKVEIELNGSYSYDKSVNSSGVQARNDSSDGDVTVTAGVVKGMDISVTLPYTFSCRETENNVLTNKAEGLNDLAITLKYQFFEHEGYSIAVKPGLILPTGKESQGLSDGKTGFSASLIVTKELSEGTYAVHANAGYERHNYRDGGKVVFSRSDIFSLSLAGEAEVSERLKLQAEWGITTNSDNTCNTTLAFVTAGGTYEYTKSFEMYAGAKFGISSSEVDVTALFGLKLKF